MRTSPSDIVWTRSRAGIGLGIAFGLGVGFGLCVGVGGCGGVLEEGIVVLQSVRLDFDAVGRGIAGDDGLGLLLSFLAGPTPLGATQSLLLAAGSLALVVGARDPNPMVLPWEEEEEP